MNKKIDNNGYVDLELPSGTLWATCNVGASKPSDFGQYFQWGDTKGCTKEQVGKNKVFNWYYYKFGKLSNFTKYTKEGDTLVLEDDAANINMKGDWHMPTPQQIRELIDNTISTWRASNGVNGRLFTSKKDSSKSIFFPAAGYCNNGSVNRVGYGGYVWSSSLRTSNPYDAWYLYFYSSNCSMSNSNRCNGRSVRGVRN